MNVSGHSAGAVAITFLLAAVAAIPVPADAQEVFRRIPDVIVPEPHGSVRTRTDGSRIRLDVSQEDVDQSLSVDLSEACSRLVFNQQRQGKYYTIVASEGRPPQRYGFASGAGLNLHDPTGLRDGDANYLFYRDGTSECRVYMLDN